MEDGLEQNRSMLSNQEEKAWISKPAIEHPISEIFKGQIQHSLHAWGSLVEYAYPKEIVQKQTRWGVLLYGLWGFG